VKDIHCPQRWAMQGAGVLALAICVLLTGHDESDAPFAPGDAAEAETQSTPETPPGPWEPGWIRVGDPKAVEILLRLQTHAEKGGSLSWSGDPEDPWNIYPDPRRITSPPEFRELIDLGEPAVPSILAFLRASLKHSDCYDSELITLLAVLGSPEVRPFLESFLTDPDGNHFAAAAEALGRLGDRAALGALRGCAPENEYVRILVLGARLRLGDDSVVPELARIGLSAPHEGLERPLALARLLWSSRLLELLGLETDARARREFFDEARFLAAAGKACRLGFWTAPWPLQVPALPAFRDPFRTEKEKTWKLLVETWGSQSPGTKPRILPSDPACAEADLDARLFFATGRLHANTMRLFLFLPETSCVRVWRLSSRGPSIWIRDAEERRIVRLGQAASLPRSVYGGLIAGLRTAMETPMIPLHDEMSRRDEETSVSLLQGLPGATQGNDMEAAGSRSEDQVIRLKLLVAERLIEDTLLQHAGFVCTDLPAPVRSAFLAEISRTANADARRILRDKWVKDDVEALLRAYVQRGYVLPGG
jgi:hypothetical protein